MAHWAALAAAAPWLSAYDAARRRLLACDAGPSVAAALNAALAEQPPVEWASGRLRFVSQAELPHGEAYEAFIFRTGRVPTRDNLHDLFNGLVWLTFPQVKRRLNQLHAEQIARHGITATRGRLRDALTLVDENAAWLQAPPELVEALRRRDWHTAFVSRRALWNDARLTLFGHALLEKLAQPRKAITAHVWCLAGEADLQSEAIAVLDTNRLAAREHLCLPVLGVPGWWPANESPDFYADAAVFRPRQARQAPITRCDNPAREASQTAAGASPERAHWRKVRTA